MKHGIINIFKPNLKKLFPDDKVSREAFLAGEIDAKKENSASFTAFKNSVLAKASHIANGVISETYREMEEKTVIRDALWRDMSELYNEANTHRESSRIAKWAYSAWDRAKEVFQYGGHEQKEINDEINTISEELNRILNVYNIKTCDLINHSKAWSVSVVVAFACIEAIINVFFFIGAVDEGVRSAVVPAFVAAPLNVTCAFLAGIISPYFFRARAAKTALSDKVFWATKLGFYISAMVSIMVMPVLFAFNIVLTAVRWQGRTSSDLDVLTIAERIMSPDVVNMLELGDFGILCAGLLFALLAFREGALIDPFPGAKALNSRLSELKQEYELTRISCQDDLNELQDEIAAYFDENLEERYKNKEEFSTNCKDLAFYAQQFRIEIGNIQNEIEEIQRQFKSIYVKANEKPNFEIDEVWEVDFTQWKIQFKQAGYPVFENMDIEHLVQEQDAKVAEMEKFLTELVSVILFFKNEAYRVIEETKRDCNALFLEEPHHQPSVADISGLELTSVN